jgi:hypothetical protein
MFQLMQPSVVYRCLQEVSLHHPGTSPEHVLSCVPNEGIFVTLAALLSPGDVVVAMHPGVKPTHQMELGPEGAF